MTAEHPEAHPRSSRKIRTRLDDATHARFHALRRNALTPKVRDRIEMVNLSDAGWSPPRIAAQLGYCGQTVRDLLRDLLAGIDSLDPRRTESGPRRRQRATAGRCRGVASSSPTRHRWQRGVAVVEAARGRGRRQVLRRQALSPEAKARMKRLVEDLTAAYKEDIQGHKKRGPEPFQIDRFGNTVPDSVFRRPRFIEAMAVARTLRMRRQLGEFHPDFDPLAEKARIVSTRSTAEGFAWPRPRPGSRTGSSRASASERGALCARIIRPTETPGTSFPHDHARSRAYRWNEDGLGGFCKRFPGPLPGPSPSGTDEGTRSSKERLFGLLRRRRATTARTSRNITYHLDATPTHSYIENALQISARRIPLSETGRGKPPRRTRSGGVRADRRPGRRALGRGAVRRVHRVYPGLAGSNPLPDHGVNRGPIAAAIHVLPHLWFRNTWSWGHDARKPRPTAVAEGRTLSQARHRHLGEPSLVCRTGALHEPELLFTENETNHERLFGAPECLSLRRDAFTRP